MEIRTRFAPSPTGYLHIGGLRTALYAYLFAKKYNGKFILRIEDTDQERFVEGATEVIYSTLHEAGLNWDEGPDIGGDYGPYVQTERRPLYKKHAEELIARGGAYYCFCTKDELEERREAVTAAGETFKYDKHCLNLSRVEIQRRMKEGQPYVIRQNIPLAGTTTFYDLIFGSITVDNASLDDNVLMKADGLPTYNFANVVDDHLMNISHVMRGTEYLSSSPKYNRLYEGFGWEVPLYIHMPPVMKNAQKKLSKRDGDASYDDFVKKGFLKDAIVNYIALLGWNPGTTQEKFTLEELKEAFSLEGLSKSPAIFDAAKMTWLNAEYVRALPADQFRRYAEPYYEKAGLLGYNYDILDRILQPRVEIFSQIPDMVDFIVALPEYDAELFTNKKSKTDAAVSKAALETVLLRLQSLPTWTESALHDLLLSLAAELGWKNGTLLWPTRIALCGKLVTPGGAIEAAGLMGKEEALRRIHIGLEKLQ